MGRSISIRPVEWEYGRFPGVLALNPEFREGQDIIKLQLEVRCDGDDPFGELRALHHHLESVCPSLADHNCRGGMDFRHFPESSAEGHALDEGEPGLAAAHLIEHVMIDTIAYLSRAESVSGITGALNESTDRFDVFVECPDSRAGEVAVHLALGWTSAILSGPDLNGRGRLTLELARHLYLKWPNAVSLAAATRSLGLATAAVRQAFRWLEDRGIARGEPQTINFSGEPFLSLRATKDPCRN